MFDEGNEDEIKYPRETSFIKLYNVVSKIVMINPKSPQISF